MEFQENLRIPLIFSILFQRSLDFPTLSSSLVIEHSNETFISWFSINN